MSDITTRSGKGSPLTNTELDANFTNLNNDKAEKTVTVSAGTGLTGGGDLSANRTIALATSGVTAGSVGSSTQIPILEIDQYGRVTDKSYASISTTPSWSSITDKPTTLSGYGITDAQNTAAKNAANGYAGLDSSGLIPSALLPSYVDDIMEFADYASFPATGETGKIYVSKDTNKTYRWSGSAYVEISASPGSTDAVTEGSTNLYFTTARARNSVGATQNLSYNATTGVFTGPDLSGYLTTSSAETTYQPKDADLTAIAGLTGTSGLLKKTAADTWTLDTNTYLTGITSGQVTTALGYTPYNATNPNGYTTNTGTVTSVGMTVPTGLSVSGTPITGSGTLAVTLTAGYSIPTTANQTNWSTAYGWGNHASAGYLTSASIGSTVQAYDADLTSWAGIAPASKQDTLVSATNIKTINGSTLLGSGDLAVSGMVYPGAGIAVSTGSAWSTSLTAPSGNLVGDTDVDTLTNKRITPRVTTTTSTATPSINTDTTDMYGLTALAVNITSVTVTGTPTNGQKLWIYIVGTAARTIAWGASFESSTVVLPSTTVSTNRLDVGFVWNAATSKWRCVAAA